MKKKTKSAKTPAKKAKKATAKKKPALKAKAAKKSTVKAKTKSSTPKRKGGGLTVQDLFRMKQEKEQAAAAGADWQHKKDLPAQDQHSPEDAKDHGARKSGFGGVRHH